LFVLLIRKNTKNVFLTSVDCEFGVFGGLPPFQSSVFGTAPSGEASLGRWWRLREGPGWLASTRDHSWSGMGPAQDQRGGSITCKGRRENRGRFARPWSA